MTMQHAFEFIVTIRDGWVSSHSVWEGGDTSDVPQIRIEEDALRDSTITVMQDWLDRWGTLTKLDPTRQKNLPVLDTFRVIGRHLYELAFPGEIGTEFGAIHEAAKRRDRALRVSLRFEGQDWYRVAAYPWEFLYRQTGDRSGFFIGSDTTTRLVLSRDISKERTAVRPYAPPLKVMFILSMPDCDEFKTERETLLKMTQRVRPTHGPFYREIIENWDTGEIKAVVADQKPHVVHVFGVCRGMGREMLIALRKDDNGNAIWDSPDAFVTGLKSIIVGDHIPRLVVLHLCQASAVDYAATFGLVAPEVIEAGFPAVLAMQYPLPVDASTTDFAEKFYTWLQEGESLGGAVQHARAHLGTLTDSHLFGAPVLYLQSDDVVVLDTPSNSSSGAAASVGATPASRNGARSSLTDRLLNTTNGMDDAAAQDLRAFVRSLNGRGVDEIGSEISKRATREDSDSRKKALYGMLTELQMESAS